MILVDFGARVDGPGVGFPVVYGALMLSGAAGGAIGSLLLGLKWPWARWIGWPSGFALFVAIVFSRAPIGLLHLSWERGCARDNADACHAHGSRFEGEERRVFERKACTLGRHYSCEHLLDSLQTDGTEADRKVVCDKLGLTCGTCIHNMCGVPMDTCMKVNAACQ